MSLNLDGGEDDEYFPKKQKILNIFNNNLNYLLFGALKSGHFFQYIRKLIFPNGYKLKPNIF